MKYITKKWKGKIYSLWVEKKKDTLWIHYKGQTWSWSFRKTKNKEEIPSLRDKIFSPMPGKIQLIPFKEGDTVKKGDTLLVMSAMKMEYTFKAEDVGKIKKIHCNKNDMIKENELLLEIDYKKPVKKNSAKS